MRLGRRPKGQWLQLRRLGCVGVPTVFALSAGLMLIQPPYWAYFGPPSFMFLATCSISLAMRGLLGYLTFDWREREAAMERDRRIRDGLPPDPPQVSK